MTTRARTVRRPGAAAVRRKTAWDDQILAANGIAVTSRVSIPLVEDVADPEKRGCTIVRIIVGLDLWPLAPAIANGSVNATIGIAIVSDDSFVANAMPDPEAQDDYPVSGWLYRARYRIVDTTTGGEGQTNVRVDRDLKVMRKIDRSTVVMIIHNEALEGTSFTMAFSGLVRVLYKLP